VPPDDPAISLAPLPKTESRNAEFKFSAVGASSYECALNALGDSPSFGVCKSTETYESLADGSYTFSVRAVDAAGNKSNITRYVWMVDGSPPEVKFLSPADGGFVRTKTPSIDGKIDDPFSRVKIFIDEVFVKEVPADADGVWSLPATAELGEGSHRVYVKAINQIGVEGLPSSIHKFTVDTVPPATSIIIKPPKNSNSNLALFEFGSDEAEVEFQCQLDGAAYNSCSSIHFFRDLEERRHTLLVRAKDRAGNEDSSPAFYEWFVVIGLPGPPEVLEPVEGAAVAWESFIISGKAKPNSTVTLYFDGKQSGVAQANDSGDWNFRPPEPLLPGQYRLTTETTDVAGNKSEHLSEVRVFTIIESVKDARAIGGGLSCASSGAHPASAWGLLGSGLWLAWYHRRRGAVGDLRGMRSKVSGS